MILSASRRTDLPSYYGEWFVNRLREGYLLVQNPYHAHRASKLLFSPETVECIVFWTKNPAPMLPRLPEITALGYTYYFQYTLTPYGSAWEQNLPPLPERVKTLRSLSEELGRERVVWRYDPILFDGAFDEAWHIRQFSALCGQLRDAVDEVVISFVDSYARRRNPPVSPEQMVRTGAAFAEIAAEHGLRLATCCEQIAGVRRAACIDRERVERLIGCPIEAKKDPGQRSGCGCIESVDVGAYGSCKNGCRYCYATRSAAEAERNWRRHDPASPLLIGWPEEGLIVREKELRPLRRAQQSLF